MTTNFKPLPRAHSLLFVPFKHCIWLRTHLSVTAI
ncbi:hypothetical protein AB205_0075280 [Aquarana catesbeiana]|uniref:Uncharacterized protein n=1 Tax=Aquarana catesbeiana TaxID=8400 RepID=A0A2G9RVJ2_AQUCT|nr:hypothetical protein AB205_0075280 [Aquarana catesbeiana]